MTNITHHIMTLLSFFNEEHKFYDMYTGDLINQTEVSPVNAQKVTIQGSKWFLQCLDYCESHFSTLPTYKEINQVEKFKLKHHEMIINMSQTNSPVHQLTMTEDDCQDVGDPNLPPHIRLGWLLSSKLIYFVSVRMG